MSDTEYIVMMLNHLNGNPPSKKDLKTKGDPVKSKKRTTRQYDFRTKQGDVGIRAF